MSSVFSAAATDVFSADTTDVLSVAKAADGGCCPANMVLGLIRSFTDPIGVRIGASDVESRDGAFWKSRLKGERRPKADFKRVDDQAPASSTRNGLID